MLPANRLFQSSEIAADKPLSVGRSGDWIVFATGNWMFYLHRLSEGRFPRFDDLLGDPSSAKTTLTLGGRDADFLRRSLEFLPVDDECHLPVMLHLNGEVVIRARAAENAPPTELVLTDSRYTGEAARVAVNRKYLARAVKLGFTQISLNGEERPVFCDDGSRQYLWMTLGKACAVPPAADARRIESSLCSESHPKKRSASTHQDSGKTTRMKTTEQPVTENAVASPVAEAPPSQPRAVKQRAKTKPTASSTLAQAIAVRDALREALGKSHELVRTLKRQKKHSRIVESTLASLKQLQAVA